MSNGNNMKKELVTDIKQVHPGDLVVAKSYKSLTDPSAIFMPADPIGKTNVFYVLVSGNGYLDCASVYRSKPVSFVGYVDIPTTYPLQRGYKVTGIEFDIPTYPLQRGYKVTGIEFKGNVIYKLDKSNPYYHSIIQMFQLFLITSFSKLNAKSLIGLNHSQRFNWNTDAEVEKCIKEYKENPGGKEWWEVGGYEISKYLLSKVL
jgi:hypothetical protein